jgi:hypothetical protein
MVKLRQAKIEKKNLPLLRFQIVKVISTQKPFFPKSKKSKSRARLCFGEIFCLLKTMTKIVCFVNVFAEEYAIVYYFTKIVHQV